MKNMNTSNQLNLTRKWRSQNFEEIVGQDLVVRVLKNSLYKNHFFPVYLFAGQRGCGKTSTARVFAAALNCESLEQFQKDPHKNKIPCGTCRSCEAMLHQQHPDFIEIDAASYTGVDNIRNIIETSSFLPVLGKKKVYLIDEVHMLSKAAFNALLKILEEPPASVLFILATTEIAKIIDTVQSRSFRIFFQSVTATVVMSHLKAICDKEKILYEDDGLQLIAQESDGSVRDGINLLERARFAYPKITKKSVTGLLGHVDQESLYALAEAVMSTDVQSLIQILGELAEQNYSASSVWSQIGELWYDLVLLKHGAAPKVYLDVSASLQAKVQEISVGRLLGMFEYIVQAEQAIGKVSKKQAFLEMSLLRLASFGQGAQPAELAEITTPSLEIKKKSIIDQWDHVLEELKQGLDPMIYSVFKEAKLEENDGLLTMNSFTKFLFFEDVINEHRPAWMKVLKKYGGIQKVELIFDLVQTEPRPTERIVRKAIESQAGSSFSTSKYKKLSSEEIKDLKITSALLSHFDGDVYNITITGKS